MELISAIFIIIFRSCVMLLIWLGELTGLGYIGVNVVIFCIIWPAVTVGLLYWLWKVMKERDELKLKISKY